MESGGGGAKNEELKGSKSMTMTKHEKKNLDFGLSPNNLSLTRLKFLTKFCAAKIGGQRFLFDHAPEH